MMLGLLLARAGVEVLVLEKHADFLRDFRGDTIHPSTLEVMHELGLLEALLKLPHQKVPRINARFVILLEPGTVISALTGRSSGTISMRSGSGANRTPRPTAS